jgi:hypothetical protein
MDSIYSILALSTRRYYQVKDIALTEDPSESRHRHHVQLKGVIVQMCLRPRFATLSVILHGPADESMNGHGLVVLARMDRLVFDGMACSCVCIYTIILLVLYYSSATRICIPVFGCCQQGLF